MSKPPRPRRPRCSRGLIAAAAIVAIGVTLSGQTPATGPPASLDAILKTLATYNGGIDSEPFWALRDYVHARKDDPAGRAECETRLLQFLKTPATHTAKMAASRHLRAIGSDRAVPALQAMLADARTGDIALYALQQIPGQAADAALVQALPALVGPARTAVIAALGRRQAASAIPGLAALLKDPAYSGAAALALGAIGGDAAAEALVAAYPGSAPDLRPAVAAAILECAERYLAAGNPAARRLYEIVSQTGPPVGATAGMPGGSASLPAPLLRAAAMGRISASGPGAAALALEMLRGPDPVLREAAIARIPDAIGLDRLGAVCDLLPRLPEAAQVPLLAVLAGYPGEIVLPAVVQAARSTSQPVRIAAIGALASAGGPSVVPLLAETAAAARGAEQAAARVALGRLKGRDVDAAVMALLSATPGEEVEREVLLAAADRRIFAAKSAVAELLESPSSRVRVQAVKTLRVIGTPSDIPAVLDVLLAADAEAETERTEAEVTTAALARKIASEDGRARTVRTRLADEEEPAARARLIGILPLIGDASALPALREALAEGEREVRDAAVRALSAWPTGAAREDVFRLARDSRSETDRLLAIRGFVRIVGLDRYRDPAAAVADLRSAAAFSWRPEEQVLILGALGQFPCVDALDLATSFLSEPAVQAEAEAAIEKIKARLPKRKQDGDCLSGGGG